MRRTSAAVLGAFRTLSLMGLLTLAGYALWGAHGSTGVSAVLGPTTTGGTSNAVTPPLLHIPRFPGQGLSAGPIAEAGGLPTAADIVRTVRAQLGAAYAWIGDTPKTGFSCVGLAHYVFAQNGVQFPESENDAYLAAPRVARAQLRPGDVVFFANTVFPGLSHVAIMIGPDTMIGADNPSTGVEIDHLSDPYWSSHYYGATRPLANPNGHRMFEPGNEVGSQPLQDAITLSVLRQRAAGMAVLPRAASVGVFSGPGYTYQEVEEVTGTLRVVAWQGAWLQVSIVDPSGMSVYGWVAAQDVRVRTNSTVESAQPPIAVTAIPTTPVPTPTATPQPLVVPGWGMVTANQLNLRRQPALGAHVLELIPYGSILQLTHRTGAWVSVVTPRGLHGWVSSLYLSTASPALASNLPATY